MDYQDRNRTFGPIFHKEEFLLPLLKLQKEIEALEVTSVGPDGKETATSEYDKGGYLR